jgi:hypothetical protein
LQRDLPQNLLLGKLLGTDRELLAGEIVVLGNAALAANDTPTAAAHSKHRHNYNQPQAI